MGIQGNLKKMKKCKKSWHIKSCFSFSLWPFSYLSRKSHRNPSIWQELWKKGGMEHKADCHGLFACNIDGHLLPQSPSSSICGNPAVGTWLTICGNRDLLRSPNSGTGAAVFAGLWRLVWLVAFWLNLEMEWRGVRFSSFLLAVK